MYAIKSTDDIQIEADDLAHLILTVHMIFDDLDRAELGRGNKGEIDRAQALIRIAHDKVMRLSEEVSANHLKIRGAE